MASEPVAQEAAQAHLQAGGDAVGAVAEVHLVAVEREDLLLREVLLDLEGEDDLVQVLEDVRMVELKVVEQGRARAVVHKLAALVEKGGVVFVGLDHKQGAGRGRCAGAQAGRDAKVQWHAAHQKPGLQPGGRQNPAQHRGGGGFAVRAGHGQHMAGLRRRMQDVF